MRHLFCVMALAEFSNTRGLPHALLGRSIHNIKSSHSPTHFGHNVPAAGVSSKSPPEAGRTEGKPARWGEASLPATKSAFHPAPLPPPPATKSASPQSYPPPSQTSANSSFGRPVSPSSRLDKLVRRRLVSSSPSLPIARPPSQRTCLQLV